MQEKAAREKLTSDLASKATIHSESPGIRRRAAATVVPGLPPGTDVSEFPWPDTAPPQLILSYATLSALGLGLKYTWAIAHAMRNAGYVAFHGKMVLGGDKEDDGAGQDDEEGKLPRS